MRVGVFRRKSNMKKAVVCGGGGFIGGHLVKRLKSEGYWVRAVDIKFHEYEETSADDFIQGDLRDITVCQRVFDQHFDEVYQLAADMGGAGFVFTGDHDADIMHNSATINLNVLETCRRRNISRIFYSSSACMYPEHNQLDPKNPNCVESSAYPANPDSEYGWEKLFSERLYFAFNRNFKLDVRVARFHNIFGPQGTWTGGKEKAPAAMLRKASETISGNSIEVWGDGLQTRSFLYVDECVEAVLRFMDSDFLGPVNIGSVEMVTINQLADMAIDISGKKISVDNIEGQEFFDKYGFKCPVGVRGRNSDNKLYKEKIGWEVNQSLKIGMQKTYKWIDEQVNL
jgi:nucleoside-diphosphate-sugar epimerase